MHLVLCDDHLLFVEPLATALASHGHRVVVTTSVKEVLPAVAEHRPEACVLDVHFPDGSGLEVARRLRDEHPECLVLMLSTSVNPADLDEARLAGVAGFVRKDQPVAAILDALDRIAAGSAVGLAAPPAGAAATRSENGRAAQLVRYLTPREREVVRCLLDAADTSEIARRLKIAPSTARTHVQNVLVKLGVHSRLQAVSLITDAGLDTEFRDITRTAQSSTSRIATSRGVCKRR